MTAHDERRYGQAPVLGWFGLVLLIGGRSPSTTAHGEEHQRLVWFGLSCLVLLIADRSPSMTAHMARGVEGGDTAMHQRLVWRGGVWVSGSGFTWEERMYATKAGGWLGFGFRCFGFRFYLGGADVRREAGGGGGGGDGGMGATQLAAPARGVVVVVADV